MPRSMPTLTAASRWARPAHTRSRAARPAGPRTSTAATAASWGCHCSRSTSCWHAWSRPEAIGPAERRAPSRPATMPAMQDILINWTPQETRVAIVENGAVQELHLERALERGLVGNIYLGKVARVLPGMQSAFVDIGLERAAFLHVA